MSEAIDFFSDETIEKMKCTLLQEDHSKALDWEQEIASVFSPSIVEDDEIIVRSWYVPIHIELDTGILKPSAYSDAYDKGLSVNRKRYASLEEIKKAAIDQAIEMSKIRSPRDYYGYSTAQVATIRDDILYGIRIFTVYDTSIDSEKGISHADVCAILAQDPNKVLSDKSLRRLVRGRLSEHFSDIIILKEDVS